MCRRSPFSIDTSMVRSPSTVAPRMRPASMQAWRSPLALGESRDSSGVGTTGTRPTFDAGRACAFAEAAGAQASAISTAAIARGAGFTRRELHRSD